MNHLITIDRITLQVNEDGSLTVRYYDQPEDPRAHATETLSRAWALELAAAIVGTTARITFNRETQLHEPAED